MEYPSAKLDNHMVGRTASVISPFYSLLPDVYVHPSVYKLQEPPFHCYIYCSF